MYYSNYSDENPNEFESSASVRGYPIEVPDMLVERAATALSTNDMVVDRQRSAGHLASAGTARRIAMDMSQ